ncbi:MAG: hypothetical protein QW199_03250 [Candidatus Pacearchaeota archaeon]
MVLANVLGESVTQNILILILILIIFVILFDILSRTHLFKRPFAAIIAFIITLIALQTGLTRALALKILQVSAGGFAIVLAIVLAIIFILFVLRHLGIGKGRQQAKSF